MEQCCAVKLPYLSEQRPKEKKRAWEGAWFSPHVTGQEVCQTIHNLYIRVPFLLLLLPLSPITHLLHHSPPPALSFSDIHLILSHFLCSHLLNLLLHLFSNFIFRLPTSLPPPPAYLFSISVLQTEMWSLLGKVCQLSLCSRIFWLFSERLSVQRGTLTLWFIFWAVSYFRKRDFKKGHTTSCSPWRYCNNKFFFQSVNEGAKNRALYCRRKEV